jgi:peptidoglycan/xylan/chitin deacetylase (PgdA/CDA1 family)
MASLRFSAVVPRRLPVIVALRYDDYSNSSPTDFELRLIESLDRLRIPCTFGVIPFLEHRDVRGAKPLTPNKTDILRNIAHNDIFEIALHGYAHKELSENGRSKRSEFAGLGFAAQYKKISLGKIFLEQLIGEKVETFIPPWNSYDKNTLRVLEALEFQTISACNTVSVIDPNAPPHFKFLPQTCSLRWLRSAIESARKNCKSRALVVVVFHAYDFIEVNKSKGTTSFEDFLELLAWLKSQKDIDLLNIGQATRTIQYLTYRTLLSNQSILRALSLRPVFRPLWLQNVYLDPFSAKKFRIKEWLITGSFSFAFLVVGFLTSYHGGALVATAKSPLIFDLKLMPVLATLCLLLLLAASNFSARMGHRRAMIAAFLAGIAVGSASLIVKLGPHFSGFNKVGKFG